MTAEELIQLTAEDLVALFFL